MRTSGYEAAFIVLCGLLCFPLVAAGADSTQEGSIAVGPVAGERSEYDLKFKMRFGDTAAQQADFKVTVYRLSGQKGDDAVVVSEQKGSGLFGQQMPLAFVRIGKDGRPVAKQMEPTMSMPGALASGMLFTVLETPSLEPGARWKGEEDLPIFGPLGSVSVEYQVHESAGDPSKIQIRSELAGAKPDKSGMGLAVKSWKRHLEVDKTKHRPLSGRIELTLEMRRGFVQTQGIEVEITDRTHTPIPADALASLPREIAALREAQDAATNKLMQLFRGGGGDENTGKETPDPVELLGKYEKEFPDGLLAFAVKPMRESLEEQIKMVEMQLQGDQRGRELVSKPAPDFTLKDLEGKDVSLKAYRGKTVLLAFWGYG